MIITPIENYAEYDEWIWSVLTNILRYILWVHLNFGPDGRLVCIYFQLISEVQNEVMRTPVFMETESLGSSGKYVWSSLS